MSDITIRNATLADAPRILEIYAYYVEHTVITFEYDVPSLAEFEGRMRAIMQKYPYLVIEQDGRIEGYAYRVYDEDTVHRIEQILFLRSVRIPLRDIAVLLRGEDTREAIEIFRRRIAEMDAEIDQLTAVRRLLRYLQEKVSVSGSEG